MPNQDTVARLRANADILRQMAAETANEEYRQALLRSADYHEDRAKSLLRPPPPGEADKVPGKGSIP